MSTPAAGRGGGGAGGSERKLVQDQRFKHVHSDPRFQRAAKSERKFKPDARFQKMFTDSAFHTNYKVDAWGRKVETESSHNELRKYYDMDEEAVAAAKAEAEAAAAAAAAKPAKKGAKGTKARAAAAASDDDDAPAAAAAAAKPGKGKPAKGKPAAKPAKGSRAAAAAAVDEDEDEDAEFDDDGYEGNYLSNRRMAPPSSGEDEDGEDDEDEDVDAEGEDEDEEKEDGADAEAEQDDEEEEDADEEQAGSSADEASDIEMEVDVDEAEEEPIPTGSEEQASRRLAVMNLEWDRLSATDLLVLFRSFVTVDSDSAAGKGARHPVRSVKVYPSQFGKARMEEEATYGPVGIYAGNMSSEEYRRKLQEKLAQVQVPLLEEEDEGKAKEEQEDESERSSDEDGDDASGSKKRVSFSAGTATSKKRKSKVAAPTPAKPSRSAAAKEQSEEDRLATDDILSRPAFDEGDASDSDSAAGAAGGAGGDGERILDLQSDSTAFDAEKLRRYELDRLKYYYAIVECSSVAAAQALYNACDGLEFEHSSNILDLRFVPDDVSFEEDEPHRRDMATKVPSNYRAPDFYTQALQHTKVQLTWDRDDPTRTKLLTKDFSKAEEAEQDLKAYLGSSGEEDGYGSDALTEASDSGSSNDEEDEEEEVVDEDSDAEGGVKRGGQKKEKKKVILKRKARSKYLALLQEIKGDVAATKDRMGGGGEDNHEVSITFEPGLRALGADIAQRALERAEQAGETTWERHLRERQEKKREKKKKRKEKLRAGEAGQEGGSSDDEEAAGAKKSKKKASSTADDSDEEMIGGAGGKGKSDLYEDDDVEFDASDPFFNLSDEEEDADAAPKGKSKGKASKAVIADDDDDEEGVEMSSESDEGHGQDSSDSESDGEEAPLTGKAKARQFFDESLSARQAQKAKPKAKDAKDAKQDKGSKRKRGANDSDLDPEAAAREAAELELLLLPEERVGGAGADAANAERMDDKRGYSLQTLLASKKASANLSSGARLHKSKKARLAAAASATQGDAFKVDTSDARFAPLFSDAAYSIDPTDPNYKKTEGSEALLQEKARRRAEQEKQQAREVQRRKKEAAKAGTSASAAPAAASTAAAATPATSSSSASLASMVASVKRKAAEAAQKKTAVPALGKGQSVPASKRSRPDANL